MPFSQRIYAIPQRQSRIIVSRTIVVQSCLLVKLLGVEEVWSVPDVITLLDEHLAVWHVLNVLNHLTFNTGDETRATQMVRMVEILILFVTIVLLEVILHACSLQHGALETAVPPVLRRLCLRCS